MKVIECWDVQEWDGGDRNNHSYYIDQRAVDDGGSEASSPTRLLHQEVNRRLRVV